MLANEFTFYKGSFSANARIRGFNDINDNNNNIAGNNYNEINSPMSRGRYTTFYKSNPMGILANFFLSTTISSCYNNLQDSSTAYFRLKKKMKNK